MASNHRLRFRVGEELAGVDAGAGSGERAAQLVRVGEVAGAGLQEVQGGSRQCAAGSASVGLGRSADWSMGVFWLSNLSDGSARVSPSVTFRPAGQLTLRASASVTYGEDGAEMTPFGTRAGASLTATLGSGRF